MTRTTKPMGEVSEERRRAVRAVADGLIDVLDTLSASHEDGISALMQVLAVACMTDEEPIEASRIASEGVMSQVRHMMLAYAREAAAGREEPS